MANRCAKLFHVKYLRARSRFLFEVVVIGSAGKSREFVRLAAENRVGENFPEAICSGSLPGGWGKGGGFSMAWEQTSENNRTIRRALSGKK